MVQTPSDRVSSKITQPRASNEEIDICPRYPDYNTYKFYGFTFELPITHKLHAVRVDGRVYRIVTDLEVLDRKACHKCRRLLHINDFYERKSPCRKCHIRTVKAWQRDNPAAVKIHRKKFNKKYRYKQKLKAAGLT